MGWMVQAPKPIKFFKTPKPIMYIVRYLLVNPSDNLLRELIYPAFYHCTRLKDVLVVQVC